MIVEILEFLDDVTGSDGNRSTSVERFTTPPSCATPSTIIMPHEPMVSDHQDPSTPHRHVSSSDVC